MVIWIFPPVLSRVHSPPRPPPSPSAPAWVATRFARYTQKLKNKDIPESGSKGTILLKQGKNDRDLLAFQQYVDSILDITIKGDGVADLYNKPEYIFLGPDEHTAGFMDGACTYAKTRDYEVWRAFTTGKSPQLGGIPHDTCVPCISACVHVCVWGGAALPSCLSD